MTKDKNENLLETFDFIKEEQNKFFDRVYPILKKSFKDDEILSLYIPHFLDVVAQIISLSDVETDLEYCKYILDVFVNQYSKNKRR